MPATEGIAPKKIALDWEQTEELCVRLVDAITRTGERFDALLVLQRGGSFVGTVLAYRFGMQGTQVLSAGINSYEAGSMERRGDFDIGQFPDATDLRGKRVLIVDEVCDSGHTLQFVIEKLHETPVEEVKSAVLHYKPTKTQTKLVPDYFVEETESWIEYPWEKHETAGKSSRVGRRLA